MKKNNALIFTILITFNSFIIAAQPRNTFHSSPERSIGWFLDNKKDKVIFTNGTLYLGGLRIERVEGLNRIQNIKDVTTIDLRTNRISILPENIFCGLPNLEEIIFGWNEILILPNNVFYDLPNLQKIFLFHNSISTLSEKAFCDLPNLEVIHLANNKISELPENAFCDLPKLKKIYLMGHSADIQR